MTPLLIYLLFVPVAVAVHYGLRRDLRRAVARAQWRRYWQAATELRAPWAALQAALRRVGTTAEKAATELRVTFHLDDGCWHVQSYRPPYTPRHRKGDA